jgi:predicted amidohydrolase
MKKNTKRIALVTMKSVDNDLQVNADKIVVYINQLKEQDVDLILFPELTLAGDAADASTYRLKSDSPCLQAIAAATDQTTAASVGFFEEAGDKQYTSQAFLSDGKVQSVYRKIHACIQGSSHGETFDVVEWQGIKIGTMICADLHYPVIARELAKRGALIILHPSAYGNATGAGFYDDGGCIHNVYMPRTRAIENGVFFLHVNASGYGKNDVFWGNAIAVAPDGRILARIDDARATENTLIIDIDVQEALDCARRQSVEEDIQRIGLVGRVKALK